MDDDYFLPLTSPAPLERILQTLSLSADAGTSHIDLEIQLIEAEANLACWERCRRFRAGSSDRPARAGSK